MTKPQKRAAARELRRNEGLTLKEIAERLGVAKSSVSLWVRDIPLTEQQRAALMQKSRRYAGRVAGSKAVKNKYRKLREQYQQAGREKAREGDPLHLAGCMLYWAEGSKTRNVLKIVNSDAVMMQYFMRFLRDCMSIPNELIKINVSYYDNNGIPGDEIEQYWLDLLELTQESLNKSIVNNQPSSSKQQGRKLPYGVCTLTVTRTELVQHIFGAIQEYTGIDKPEWLM